MFVREIHYLQCCIIKVHQIFHHIVTTGKFEGKRGWGRLREKILDGLVRWHGKRTTEQAHRDNTKQKVVELWPSASVDAALDR